MTTTNTPNLFQKIAAISAEVGKIEKDGQNQAQNYRFISHAGLMGHLRSAMAERNVVIVPEIILADDTAGERGWRVALTMQFTLVNGDNPEDRLIAQWRGEAADSSDKATSKAATSGEKYFLMKLFKVSDRDDADAESPEAAPQHRPAQARPAQAPVRQASASGNAHGESVVHQCRHCKDQTNGRFQVTAKGDAFKCDVCGKWTDWQGAGADRQPVGATNGAGLFSDGSPIPELS